MTNTNLEGKIAIVTGASSGIGETTAKALAQEGVKVGLSARREKELERVAAEIEQQGGTALVLPTDLRQRDQISAMVDRTVATFGTLDILINNAGFGHWEPIANADIDAWQNEIELNLQGVMYTTRYAVDIMLKQSSGHIINVSSLAGRNPGPGWPGYSASKWGLTGFSLSIGRDLSKKGIRVTLIEPGEVDTPMQDEEDRAKGHFLAPEDIANAILYALTQPSNVCIMSIQLHPA